jgi:hypothetical protein
MTYFLSGRSVLLPCARTYANQSALNSGFHDPKVYSCNAACIHAPSLQHCVLTSEVPEGGADMAIDSVEMTINPLVENVVGSLDVRYVELSNAPLIINFDPMNSDELIVEHANFALGY